MKKIYLSMAVLALTFTACKKEEGTVPEMDTANDTIVQQETVPEQPMDSAAVAQAWEKYMTPTDAHKMMAEEEGSWNCEMTFWMGPDVKPEKYTSTADIKMIMGGRYQESAYKGDMMGMPFEGKSTLAFDNTTEEYTSTWIDNMGTGMMVMRGKMSPASQKMVLKGEMVDPVSGKAKPVREVYSVVDENTRKMEMFDNHNGTEYKSMEIVMTRK